MKEKVSIFKRKLEKKEELAEPPKPPEEAKEQEPPKEQSLKESIKELSDKFEELGGKKDIDSKFKKKSFKMPYKVKTQLKRGILQNKIQVILMCHNKTLLTTIGEFKYGQLVIETTNGKRTWCGEEDIVWNWNGKIPTAIVPEWDLIPLTRTKLITDAVEAKSLSAPSDIAIRKIEAYQALAQEKKKMDTRMMIIIFVVLAGAAYVLFGGGN